MINQVAIPCMQPAADAMRCISLIQQWAGLMAAGIKRVENRTRPMIRRSSIGSQFSLQASRKLDESVYPLIDTYTFVERWRAGRDDDKGE